MRNNRTGDGEGSFTEAKSCILAVQSSSVTSAICMGAAAEWQVLHSERLQSAQRLGRHEMSGMEQL